MTPENIDKLLALTGMLGVVWISLYFLSKNS